MLIKKSARRQQPFRESLSATANCWMINKLTCLNYDEPVLVLIRFV